MSKKFFTQKTRARFCICFVALFLTLFVQNIFAQNAQVDGVKSATGAQNVPLQSASSNKTRVFDEANLFSSAQKLALKNDLNNFCKEFSADLVLVTTSDSQGLSSMEFADNFYDNGNFGVGANYDGALILIDMDNREFYVSTSGSAINILTPAKIDRICARAVDYLANEDFYGAANCAIADLRAYFAKKYQRQNGNSADGFVVAGFTLPFTAQELLIALAIGLIASIITCVCVATSYRFRRSTYAYPFYDKGSLNLTLSHDCFVNKIVTTRKIEQAPPATHTSASGHTHGGGGKKF